MADIKFARDFGYSPASPFWLVWNEDGRVPMHKHATRADAEAEAARLAANAPGRSFHVLAVMASVRTSADIVGEKFDPTRAPPRVVDEDPEPAPAFLTDEPL